MWRQALDFGKSDDAVVERESVEYGAVVEDWEVGLTQSQDDGLDLRQHTESRFCTSELLAISYRKSSFKSSLTSVLS